MQRYLGAILAAVLFLSPPNPARADEARNAVLDKAIKALGGAEKLGKLEAFSWKSKGKITINDDDNEISIQATAQGLDHFRSEFQGEFGGNTIKGVSVVNGDKAWRKFGDNSMEMDANALANEKRTLYLQLTPILILPLKGKGFKVETAGEEKVGDKAAVALKVTGPDGKDFKLFFDKESGLPVRLTATVAGFNGEEYVQETTFSDYKEFAGIKKATKVESKRDGQKFISQEITEFKALDKPDPKLFEEPQ
jgi:hypothetical protein